MIAFVIFLIIGIIMLIVGVRYDSCIPSAIGGGLFSVGLFSIMIAEAPKAPKAIDVYQGKTTLEITYKDGIPIDSVVVFKSKEK